MKGSELVQSFVMHFGEMGSRWGINRTVGQIYALLYVSEQPLCADDLVEQLGVSRSNVSMGLKELQSWNLVHITRQPGDRRDFFSSPDDVWLIFQRLAEERQRREVDPTLSMLRTALMSEPDTQADQYAQQRLREMHDLIELMTRWFAEVRNLRPSTLKRLMRMGAGVSKLLEVSDKVRQFPKRKAEDD